MSWDIGLPRVDVPQGDQPKHCTIVLPYYENPRFLDGQLTRFEQFPPELSAHIDLIVCDDASQRHQAEDVIRRHSGKIALGTGYRLFRNTGLDIAWNWIGARNRGAHEAWPESWLLMTDMDHVLPQSTAEALVYGKHDPGTVYAFERLEHSGERIHPHSASFFMTREMFWKIGGYDERFAGHYGSDGQYRKRLRATAPLVISSDRLIRYERHGDSSTTAYARKTPEDNAAIARIAKEIEGTPPLVLSFPYVEVPL